MTATAGSNSNMHCISSHAGCGEIYRRHMAICMRSSLPHGNPDHGSCQLQYDSIHSMALKSHPCADPSFSSGLSIFGPKAIMYPQIVGSERARVPLPLDLDENVPIYVNPKQYCGILKRRQVRAKLESQNKLVKARKPYLHESRHLHALKRARGSGGRFLNTKNLQRSKPLPPTNAYNLSHLQLGGNISGSGSEVHQSETGSWGASTPNGSDVPSIFNGDEIYQHPELRAPNYPLHRGATMQGREDLTRNQNQTLHLLSVRYRWNG